MYKLTLNKEQAKVIAQALDLFARIGCGQFEELLRHPTMSKRMIDMMDNPNYLERKESIETGIYLAKLLIADLPPNASISIVAADEHNRIAYDIYQVIRHKMAWEERPEGGLEVNFNEPMKWSEQPLPEIEEE